MSKKREHLLALQGRHAKALWSSCVSPRAFHIPSPSQAGRTFSISRITATSSADADAALFSSSPGAMGWSGGTKTLIVCIRGARLRLRAPRSAHNAAASTHAACRSMQRPSAGPGSAPMGRGAWKSLGGRARRHPSPRPSRWRPAQKASSLRASSVAGTYRKRYIPG